MNSLPPPQPVVALLDTPRKSAVPEDWKFKNTPEGLRQCAEIATFALHNAFLRLSKSRDDEADQQAAAPMLGFFRERVRNVLAAMEAVEAEESNTGGGQ